MSGEIQLVEEISLEIVDWNRVRSAIEHENELTNHRITWLLNSQAFLFAAFVLTFQASSRNDVAPNNYPVYKIVLSAIALTGIFVCAYLSLGILAAQKQHNTLVEWWQNRNKDHANHPPICGKAPLAYINLPYYSFPFVFWIAWIIFVVAALAEYIFPYASKIGEILLIIVAILAFVAIGFGLAEYRRRVRY